MRYVTNKILLTMQLYNPEECISLIDTAEKMGFQVARLHVEGRKNKETFIKSQYLMDQLLSRLKADVQQSEGVYFNVERIGKILEVYRYDEGEYVAPHTDSSKEVAPGSYSKYTLVLYLNDSFEGGETSFIDENISLKPKPGHAVIFEQSLLHEGSKVLSGVKYILRVNVVITA